METIRCVSLNANGLQKATKRRAVFSWLRKGKYDVCLMQETHCTDKLEQIWQAEWGAKIHFSNGQSNARGVAVMMARDSQFTVQEVKKDNDGRVIILKLARGTEVFVVANIYAPTQDHPEAQVKLTDWVEEKIAELNPSNILLGGDFNLSLNPKLDKNSDHSTLPSPVSPSG